VLAKAEQADAAVIALLKDKPMSQADVVRATGVPATTCAASGRPRCSTQRPWRDAPPPIRR
jgi:hypothetical protein